MKRCSETGKKKFHTRVDALIFDGLRVGRAFGGGHRAYHCEFCGLWHLTTQPKRRSAPREAER